MLTRSLMVLLFGFVAFIVDSADKPNIIFFLTDDWGFNDVGYYGNTETNTPFIDAIVSEEGLRIDRHYVLPECTVTRCALLTGRYPMRYGMQDGVLYYTSSYALSNYEYLLSNEYQSQGYRTHLIGKWHLGFRSWDYTPTYRGFDTFLGYYMGLMYYYSHYGMDFNYKTTIDLHINEDDYDESGVYSLEIYRNRVIDLLQHEAANQNKEINQENIDSNKPFFMYVAWQGSHNPSEAPDEYVSMYSDSSSTGSSSSSSSSDDDDTSSSSSGSSDPQSATSDSRAYFQAQTSATDDMFHDIVWELKRLNLWDNTLIVFASDNGAAYGFGDNSPLRGAKFTLWEGGVRVPAFITGGYLPDNKKGKVFNKHAMHVTDWYKTLLNGVSNLDTLSSNEIDGVNMWDYLINENDDTPQFNQRKEDNLLLPHKDAFEKENRDKFNNDNNNNNINNKNNENKIGDMTMDERYILLNVNSADCDTNDGVCGSLIYGGRWKLLLSSNQVVSTEGGVNTATCFWHRSFAREVDNDKLLGCGTVPEQVDSSNTCPCTDSACLFDLESDPCEYYDVSSNYADLTEQLTAKLTEYYNEQVTPLASLFSDASYDDVNPTQFYEDDEQSYWTPWDTTTTNWQDMEFEKTLSVNYQNVAIDNSNSRMNNKNKKKDNDNDDKSEKNENKDKNSMSYSKIVNNEGFIIFVASGCLISIIFGIMIYCSIKTINKKVYMSDKTEISPLMSKNRLTLTGTANAYQSV